MRQIIQLFKQHPVAATIELVVIAFTFSSIITFFVVLQALIEQYRGQ